MRLAIVTTHPVQYYAPFFQKLQKSGTIIFKVFYTAGAPEAVKFDKGFKRNVDWDVSLLDGYHYEWVENISSRPGSNHFRGIINPGLLPKIESFHPDAVLVYGWSYHSHLKVIRYFKDRIPVLFRGDSTLIDEQHPVKMMLRRLVLKWVYQNIDFALYVGTNNKDYYKKLGIVDKQLIFMPHAVDNDRFSKVRDAEAKLIRQSLSISETDIVILFAGKFENKKDPFLLLQSFKSLQLSNTHLLMTGNGELEEKLRSAAGTDHHIHFMGFQNQSVMPVIYQAADLFCLPSKGPAETWGLAVNEAMAGGKAILVSDKVGCARDLVQNSNGLVFDAGSMTDLESKLNLLVKRGRQGLRKMGDNSKELIQKFSFDTQVSAIENLLCNDK